MLRGERGLRVHRSGYSTTHGALNRSNPSLTRRLLASTSPAGSVVEQGVDLFSADADGTLGRELFARRVDRVSVGGIEGVFLGDAVRVELP